MILFANWYNGLDNVDFTFIDIQFAGFQLRHVQDFSDQRKQMASR